MSHKLIYSYELLPLRQIIFVIPSTPEPIRAKTQFLIKIQRHAIKIMFCLYHYEITYFLKVIPTKPQKRHLQYYLF